MKRCKGVPLNGCFFEFFVVFGCSLWIGLCALPVLSAERPLLSLPIECNPGRNCWLVNLVDTDIGPGRRDFLCGRHTYDSHKGTDFAIQDLAAMEKGVAVLAAAPGTVKARRDGMADKQPDEPLRRNQQIYCGNGVVISHKDGWETQYCHLRHGSVTVKAGEKVNQGQKLGLVGHSGMAEFPHVHLAVRHVRQVIDPFSGVSSSGGSKTGCGDYSKTLWNKSAQRALKGPMTSFFNAGFAAEKPKHRGIKQGLYRAKALTRRSPVLIFWVEVWWVRKGDILSLKIIDSGGKALLNHTSEIPKFQSRRMAYAGKPKRQLFWESGKYTGIGELSRIVNGKTHRFMISKKILIRD